MEATDSLPHDLDETIARLRDIEGAAESLAHKSNGHADEVRTIQHALRAVNKDLSELRSELD